MQNAAVRRLGVADLTTTVLTQTLTGIASESWLGGGTGARTARRILAVLAMFLGAVVGAVLLIEVAPYPPIAFAATLLTLVAAAAGGRLR